MAASSPTCRTCWLKSLSPQMREQVLAEPITMPVHYCSEHNYDELLANMDWFVRPRRRFAETVDLLARIPYPEEEEREP